MTYETILTEARGAVTLITLNRPQSLNALNSHVLEELISAFDAFEADPDQRCAVLTGAGEKAFAAGADIKEMADKPAADFYAGDFFSRWTSHLVNAVRKPWIAAVNGFALWPARNQAGGRAGHGRVAAADPRDRQGQGNGNVPDGPDDGRGRSRAERTRCARRASGIASGRGGQDRDRHRRHAPARCDCE
jgi:Enoyl-CoA hydratase/isomerase